MKSNYKRLGNYIEEINVRNKEEKVTTLLGVSIRKVLMPSIANTIGSDMSKYKIIETNQFAYGPITSRNGDKISIALNDGPIAIISQAYKVFKVINWEELLPEYLMMWFRRPEFDRYARFKSHGSTRESFDWDELCEVELPVPSLKKQQEIVNDYNTVQERIAINEQLNKALEATAQALYKHWFVDFEFPYDFERGVVAVEHEKPYQSSGGEMVFNEELDKEIPEGWEVITVKEFCKEMKSGGTPSRSNPIYWNSKDIPWLKTGEVSNNIVIKAEEYISKIALKKSSAKLFPINTILMAMYGATAAQISMLKFESTSNQACCGMICNNEYEAAFLYHHLLYNQKNIANMATGGAQPNLNKNLIESLRMGVPENRDLVEDFKKFQDQLTTNTIELDYLETTKTTLLSKIATVTD